MQKPVFQNSLPHAPWTDPSMWRLPGVLPLDPADWLVVDDAFAGQMSLRDGMIGALQNDICRVQPEAEDAAQECLDTVLAALAQNPSYEVGPHRVTRPDGVKVVIYRERPLLTVGRLIQEDICLLQKSGDEHVLTGAILCFPASWTLTEKIGKPLIRIHRPVDTYDDNVAKRVQRLFDAIHVDRPLWRANALLYRDPNLFHPRRENASSHLEGPPLYLRTERQTLRRLPETKAVVFSIHTVLMPLATLSDAQRAGMATAGLEIV